MMGLARFGPSVMALLREPGVTPHMEPLPDLHWLLVQVRYQQAKFKELGDAIEATIDAEEAQVRH